VVLAPTNTIFSAKLKLLEKKLAGESSQEKK
jgi:hypothetical protein